jgi:PAS domain S-box-containing protein
MKYIHVAEANCKNCYKCLKVCPVKSIKYSNNHVEVLEDDCILCGRCIRNCPQKAKSLMHDISSIKALAKDHSVRKAAALAPSFVSVFGRENRLRLVTALKKLGFDIVGETAAGAREVSRRYAEILSEKRMDNMITTCCPTTVFLVQKYFPRLTGILAPVLSPMETYSMMLKKKYGEDLKVIFFAPCISKIEEARTSEPAWTDGVVTFKQLSEWLAAEETDISGLPETQLDNEPTGASVYPVYEGILDDVRAVLPRDSDVLERYNFMSVQGAKDIIELLQEIEKGLVHNCFIEASACYGSCINGPESGRGEYQPVNLALETRSFVRGLRDIKLQPRADLDLSRRIEPQPVRENLPDEKTIRAILAQIGKTTPEQELNCGSCGYRTCRDKAIAVYQGKAELYMCLPYMSQISETLANVTLSVSPDYIIAVDKSLLVRECNLAAQQLFGHSRQQIVGRPLEDFLDPVDFAIVFANSADEPPQKVRYKDRDVIVRETIVYVQDQEIAIGFMQDITKSEREREALDKLKMATMDMAQNVINKQMTVAQDIASLIGETTAETKVTLTKLKDLIIYEGRDKDEKPLH